MPLRFWQNVRSCWWMGLVACAPLELPKQVAALGLDVGEALPSPCLSWCRVEGDVRALTDATGVPIAFEASLVSRPWKEVLEVSRSKWGRPASVYQIQASPNLDSLEDWTENTRKQHFENVGRLAALLRVGDPRETTNYAVWKKKETIVRVERDTNGVRAVWIREESSSKK